MSFIQRSQYVKQKVTVHKCAGIIRGWVLYEEIRYVKIYGEHLNGIISNQLFITPFIFFQKCFTDRGWQRGKLVFLDLLALQFPNHNHCNVFLQLNNSASEVPQKLPNERCSIVEEVSLLTEIRLCNNEAQVS